MLFSFPPSVSPFIFHLIQSFFPLPVCFFFHLSFIFLTLLLSTPPLSLPLQVPLIHSLLPPSSVETPFFYITHQNVLPYRLSFHSFLFHILLLLILGNEEDVTTVKGNERPS